MSKRSREENVLRLYLQNSEGTTHKFLCIRSIYKRGKFFEYKFIFSGFPKNTMWNVSPNSVIDSVKGIRKSTSSHPFGSNLTVGYHADGNIMYKTDRNTKPKSKIPFHKISKPTQFLDIVGLSFPHLIQENPRGSKGYSVLELNGTDPNQRFSCSFYIQKGEREVNFIPKDSSTFKESQSFSFYDENEDVSIYLHTYSSLHKTEPVVVIRRRGFFFEIYRTSLYYLYEFKDSFLRRTTAF